MMSPTRSRKWETKTRDHKALIMRGLKVAVVATDWKRLPMWAGQGYICKFGSFIIVNRRLTPEICLLQQLVYYTALETGY
jgi:hypothetical protein